MGIFTLTYLMNYNENKDCDFFNTRLQENVSVCTIWLSLIWHVSSQKNIISNKSLCDVYLVS